jgi:hypothetical protein
METHTPNPAERLTILMEELRPTGAGPLRVLIWDLLTSLMRLFASLAECGPQQQVFRNDAGVEPGRVGAPGGFAVAAGDGRRSAAGGPNAGGRAAVSAAVAAAGATPEIEGATQNDCPGDDCIRHEGGVRAVRERRPRERWHPAAIARALAVSEYGSRVLEARFAKMGLRGWVSLYRFRYDIAMMADCCRACPAAISLRQRAPPR